MKIKCAIVGYGNIGKSIEKLVVKDEDFDLVGIFSRREPSTLKSPYQTVFYHQNMLLDDRFCGIEVVFLCVGSAFDLQETAFKVATRFSSVDSFDTHAKMESYVRDLDAIAKMSGTLAIVGCGWDPGIFSLQRALFDAIMPEVKPQTFWGKGVSQGHSEAIRRIEGVKYATQYTVPKDDAVKRARHGETCFDARDKHERICYVVPDYQAYYGDAEVSEEQKEKLQKIIRDKIVNMPDYFSEYDTAVHFVDEAEYFGNHTKMSHAGKVIAVEKQNSKDDSAKSIAEFSLELDSNPDFTAQVMVAYARANYRLQSQGETGAKTILDVPITALLKSDDNLKFI